MKMNDPYKNQTGILIKCAMLIAVCFFSLLSLAQTEKQKIAVFTPLYLDSAFDATGKFRYEKTGARMSSAGLDF